MIDLNRKLPIGIQTFEDIRKEGYLYVDKTELVWRMANTGKPYFLSRPRRFGKSLLLSTFEAYFEGRKELFEGFPVLLFFSCSIITFMFYQLGIINVVASGIIPISIGKWRGNKRPSRSTAAFWARNTFTFRVR